MRALIRDLRSDERGVASTVGTIMALLVFLTFLSVIVNQYVPIWMKDSEASHMNTALGQFGGFKGAIDIQMLAAQAAQDAGTFTIPVTTSTAVGLGIDGVPIFASGTPGTLELNPDAAPFTVVFDYMINGQRRQVTDQASGSVELNAANRYYTPQRIAYENGAVIRYQTDGQFIRVHPTFSVLQSNNTLDISFALVSLYGKGIVTGTTTELVSSELFAWDRQVYTGFPANGVIWINHTASRYGLSWFRFMNQTLADTLKLGGTYTRTSLDERFIAKSGATTVYDIRSTFNPTTGLYIMRLVIYNNPGIMGLAAFRLQHAQVQVSIGDATTQVQF
jgi:predicted secreted protein